MVRSIILAALLTACSEQAPTSTQQPKTASQTPLSVPTPVDNVESWTCSYRGYQIRENESPRAVIVRFTVDDQELVEGSQGQRYRILQNNEYGLIAAWSSSEVEPGKSDPTIAAFAIAIDKRTGFFSRVNLIARPDESGSPRDGSCIRDGQ